MISWTNEKLANLCEVFTDGDWIESKDQSYEGVRLIQTGNVGEGSFKDRGDKARFISESTFIKLKCTEVFKGDCLVSRLPDPVGRSCILPHTGDRMITAVDCSILRFKKGALLPEFFNYYTQSNFYLEKVESLTSGATRKRISRKNLGLVEIPVPSILEQKRIVAILDQVFSDIEQARAKTEKNLKNARELFESYLQQVFSERSDGSPQVALSEITECISDGDHAAPPKSDEGIPFITISNINKSTNEINFSDTFKVPNAYYSALKETRRPKPGDVLYTVTGSYGIPVIVRDEKEFCFQRHIGLVRPNKNVDSNWLYYLLMSPQIFRQADEGATGTAQKTVSLKLLRGLSVPEIPLITQKKMVNDLNSMYKKSKTLEKIYISKLLSLEELKKSILQKAFTGQLTNKGKQEVAA